MHGNSPSELIANFTETIGRPPELPEWIISGAVVGIQGGTETVRHIWDELRTYNVPISAFWLQVMQPYAGLLTCLNNLKLFIEFFSVFIFYWHQVSKNIKSQHPHQ